MYNDASCAKVPASSLASLAAPFAPDNGNNQLTGS